MANGMNGADKAAQDDAVRLTLALNSIVADRRALAGGLGLQFGGQRDVYAEAGYPLEIDFAQYKARYERQDMASRIVDAPALDTWRKPPYLLDGVDEKTATTESEFVQAWNELVSIEDVGDDLEDRRTIWHYLRRADQLAGIGRYGVMLVGINDGGELIEPLGKATVSGAGGLLYLSVFDEGDAKVATIENDVTSPRYGLPLLYDLNMGTTLQGSGMGMQRVHWSRVVHVAEGLLGDEIFGTPRLRAAWNRLMDLEKVMAGASEAAWKLLYKGLILSTRDGYRLPSDADAGQFREKIDEYIHGLRRALELEGMDVTIAGGEVADPTGLVTLIVSLIAATVNIPQRILLGSERGELASTQDQQTWDRYVAGRQRGFAESMLLRPLVNRLVYSGVLPKPSSGSYVVRWPDLEEIDAAVEAAVAKAAAEALAAAAAGTGQVVDLAEFIAIFLPNLPRESIRAAVTPLLPMPSQQGGEGVMAANSAPFRGFPGDWRRWRDYP